MRQDLSRIERELMLLGRHSAMGTKGRCGSPEAPGKDGEKDGDDGDGKGSKERLERSAYLLLSRIEAQGPMSIGQLAEAFGLDCSTVNRQTGAALRAGLVERILDPEGGVARKLRITEDGLDRLHHEREERLGGLGELLTDWEPGEVATLARLLTRLNAAAEERTGGLWPRS